MKNYVPAELEEKIQYKAIVEGKSIRDIKPQDALNEQELDALGVFQQILSPAYNRAMAFRAAKGSYFADVNGLGKQISEKYKPKEEAN